MHHRLSIMMFKFELEVVMTKFFAIFTTKAMTAIPRILISLRYLGLILKLSLEFVNYFDLNDLIRSIIDYRNYYHLLWTCY